MEFVQNIVQYGLAHNAFANPSCLPPLYIKGLRQLFTGLST